jgi:hypothetical protein
VPAGVAEEPAILEMEQVLRWIGFDELKASRVATQIGERICDFAEFSHSDVKMTEPTRRLRLAVWTRIHSSEPYESLPSAKLFARQPRRMPRHWETHW